MAINPFEARRLMAGLGATQQPQYTPEQKLYMDEKKSVTKLVRNYDMHPERWGKEKIQKLKALADRYEIPFEVAKATGGQQARSAIVGAVDSVLFDMIPDDSYVTPGTEGYAKAGKWAGIVIPLIASAAATIATGGAAAPLMGAAVANASKGTAGRILSNVAKRVPQAAKTMYKWTAPGMIGEGIKGAGRIISPALAARGIGTANPFVMSGLNAAQKNFVDQGVKILKTGGDDAITKAMEVFSKAGLNKTQIDNLKLLPEMQNAFKFGTSVVDDATMAFQLNKAGITGGVSSTGLAPGGTAVGKLSGVLSRISGKNTPETVLNTSNLKKAIDNWNKATTRKSLQINESPQAYLNRLNKLGITTVGEARSAMIAGRSGVTPTVGMDMSGILPLLGAGYMGMNTGQVDPLFPEPEYALGQIAEEQ